MAEVQSFLSDNIILFSILAGLIIVYGVVEIFMNQSTHGVIEVSPQKAIDLLNHQNALLLDIRPLTDFNDTHCIGAVSVHNANAKLEQFKNKPVIVVCNSGRSSITYAKELTAQGFTQALSLAGGIIGWKNADFPLTSYK
jgi:rhodanese-related sulfurtransferase